MLAAVEDGASGATATPARNAPRNTAAYSIEVPAQMAIDCFCFTYQMIEPAIMERAGVLSHCDMLRPLCGVHADQLRQRVEILRQNLVNGHGLPSS